MWGTDPERVAHLYRSPIPGPNKQTRS
jgi:hypothetical protein